MARCMPFVEVGFAVNAFPQRLRSMRSCLPVHRQLVQAPSFALGRSAYVPAFKRFTKLT